MFGNADLGIWYVLFDDIVCFFVRVDECEVGTQVFQKTFFLRWPYRFEIGVPCHHIGFIEGDPKCHVASESIRNFFGVAGEVFGETGREYTALPGKPEGECPVPEGDEGLDISRAKGMNDVLIVCEFFFIEVAFFGFDARPFDREAVCRMIQFFRTLEVFFVAVVVITRNTGNIVLGMRGFCAKFFRPAGEVSEFGRRFRGEALGIRLFPF